MDINTNADKVLLEQEALSKKVDALDENNLPTANIMVAGITGVGKSTLLNAVFGSELAATGKGQPITSRITEYKGDAVPIHIWDTVGLELDAEKTMDSIRAIRKTIADKAASGDQFDRIHAIWYCIHSASNRYQGPELEFVKNLHSLGVPFIIVLTQCIGVPEEIDQFEDHIRTTNAALSMDDIDIVQVCAQDYRLRGFTLEAFGLDVLVETTLKRLPEFIKSGFIAAQQVSKIEKRTECEKIMYQYVLKAKQGFWDKVPLANIASANNHIASMFGKMSRIYNTMIPYRTLQKVIDKSNIDFQNIFHGLINPFYGKYYKKVMSLLETKKAEGFEVNVDKLKKSDRVAVMVAFYGYTFVAAIEKLWEESTEKQLRDIDFVCRNLIGNINTFLRESGKKK